MGKIESSATLTEQRHIDTVPPRRLYYARAGELIAALEPIAQPPAPAVLAETR